MRRLAWALPFALLGTVPAVGQQRVILPVYPDPSDGRGYGAGGQPSATAYAAPKADGPVVELLDEGVGRLFPLLVNDGGGEPGTIEREDRDVFAGVEAARVTPMQKYRSVIPGPASRVSSALPIFARITFSLKPLVWPTRIPAVCAIPSRMKHAGMTGSAACRSFAAK